MNWSGLPEKSVVGRILRLPLKFLPKQAQLPILQGRLRGKKWIVGSGNHGCWLGSYELDKQQVFGRTVTPGSVVFDLGGHVGFYTLLASEAVGSTGRVFVFEPVPRNLFYLKKHLELNHTSNVTVLEVAVSDKSGTVSFEEGPSSSMGRIALEGELLVRTVVLDELISRRELPAPDYMKIDIEGAELSALHGARSMLARAHPTIFLATHGSDVHQGCCRLLHSLGYQLEPIDDRDLDHSTEILAIYRATDERRL